MPTLSLRDLFMVNDERAKLLESCLGKADANKDITLEALNELSDIQKYASFRTNDTNLMEKMRGIASFLKEIPAQVAVEMLATSKKFEVLAWVCCQYEFHKQESIFRTMVSCSKVDYIPDWLEPYSRLSTSKKIRPTPCFL